MEKVANRVVRHYSINDLLNWRDYKELRLVPWFQRREVWHEKARSYLIDTVLRNLPVPTIIIRESLDPKTGKTIREVVDGQQRVATIFKFFDGDLSIDKAHREDFAGMTFSDLPEEVQEQFRQYEFPVNVLRGANDPEVLDIFARINSYTTTLNRQEKMNAKFHGEFKSFIYRLSNKYVTFFLNTKVLSNRAVLRMAEAELISELVIGMLDGLQEKKITIEKFYNQYDEDFAVRKDCEKRFKEIIDLIENILGDELKSTNFRKRPMFYSLFLVFFDLICGFPGEEHQTYPILPEKYTLIKDALKRLSEVMDEEQTDPAYSEFVRVSIQSTDALKSRRIRHNIIKQKVLGIIQKE